MSGLKVTLVLDPADADLLAWAADEMRLRGPGDKAGDLERLRDRIRRARRHRHGRTRT